MTPEMLLYQKISTPRPKITFFWTIRAILYFIAIFIAAFGLFGAFTSFSNAHVVIGLGLFFWLGLMVAGVVLFIRIRQRIQCFGFWQLIGWAGGATVGAFMAAILEYSFLPDFSNDPVGSFIFGCIVLLYGLILAWVALW